jgi:lipopolysaccharide/colanic/teichoic acid biosynthesis glycosyltransferase
VKAAVDRTITVLLMVVAVPMMALVALAIVLVDGRPVFYRQKRVGKGGRVFRIWKFRTMCPNAERATGAVWSSAGDPRVTALGRWLRCSHLDELPQLFNVLLGDMNLIGPRPERPEFVRELVRRLPRYKERLAVRPGITGLAQLCLGYDQSVTDVQQKATLDVQYIQTTSFLRDAKILAVTLPYIFKNLLHRWQYGWRVPTSSVDGAAVIAPTANAVQGERRIAHDGLPHPQPHLQHFPPCSGEASATGTSSQAFPLSFNMESVARATDSCQSLASNSAPSSL